VSELGELYQELILEHNRHPSNYRKLDGADRTAEGYNPLCGDKVTLFLKLKDEVISDVSFLGSGCAISKASASLLTETVKGKSASEAEEIFEAFRRMVTREPGSDYHTEKLGDLEVLAGVSAFPLRVKCATLSWHTLKAAIKGEEGTVLPE